MASADHSAKPSGVFVKLVFHDESVVVRRLPLPRSRAFQGLRELCAAHLKCADASIAYLDCDRDVVCVESEAELAESLRCASAVGSDGAVRYHVAASRAAALAGALKWERRHGKDADIPSAPPVPMLLHDTPPPPCDSAPPPPPPPAPLFTRSLTRHGQALARRGAAPCSGGGGADLSPEQQQRADEAAAGVLAREGVDAGVAGSVRAYADARAAGASAVMARRRAFMALHGASLEAMARADYASACWLAEAAAALAPRLPTARYNAGCARARCGDRAGALAALREAVALGWRKARHMELDAHLATLRGDAEFAAVAASARAGSRTVTQAEESAAAATMPAPAPTPPAALCGTRRLEAHEVGAIGFADASAVDAALAASGERVDEAVGPLLAARKAVAVC